MGEKKKVTHHQRRQAHLANIFLEVVDVEVVVVFGMEGSWDGNEAFEGREQLVVAVRNGVSTKTRKRRGNGRVRGVLGDRVSDEDIRKDGSDASESGTTGGGKGGGTIRTSGDWLQSRVLTLPVQCRRSRRCCRGEGVVSTSSAGELRRRGRNVQLTILPFPVRLVVEVRHSLPQLLHTGRRRILVHVATDLSRELGDVDHVRTRGRARDVSDYKGR
jgi:hypothetical protein